MGKILYSMSGEGRGHATRARTVVEELRVAHEVVLFAPGCAFEMLDPIYRDTDVRVYRIPGLEFCYDAHRRLDYLQTGLSSASYLTDLVYLVDQLSRAVDIEEPDLVITDFEPALPRAARRCGVPFISLDHQHFLAVTDLSELPREVRMHAALMRSVVRMYYWGQDETIISSFYSAPLLPRYRHRVRQVGVLLRPEVLRARPRSGRHLLAYVRRFGAEPLLESLAACDRPVRVYGLGEQTSRGNLTFRPISNDGFIQDLASCDGLVCTAGNQLVGEALYLGKPVLAFPEENNYEQAINGFFLDRDGGGECHELAEIDARAVGRFIERIPDHRARIRPERLCGNRDVLELLGEIGRAHV